MTTSPALMMKSQWSRTNLTNRTVPFFSIYEATPSSVLYIMLYFVSYIKWLQNRTSATPVASPPMTPNASSANLAANESNLTNSPQSNGTLLQEVMVLVQLFPPFMDPPLRKRCDVEKSAERQSEPRFSEKNFRKCES
jgi:hypothetical protein